jgi:hypothetical protein
MASTGIDRNPPDDLHWDGNGPADLSSSTGRAAIGTIRASMKASNGAGWWIAEWRLSDLDCKEADRPPPMEE